MRYSMNSDDYFVSTEILVSNKKYTHSFYLKNNDFIEWDTMLTAKVKDDIFQTYRSGFIGPSYDIFNIKEIKISNGENTLKCIMKPIYRKIKSVNHLEVEYENITSESYNNFDFAIKKLPLTTLTSVKSKIIDKISESYTLMYTPPYICDGDIIQASLLVEDALDKNRIINYTNSLSLFNDRNTALYQNDIDSGFVNHDIISNQLFFINADIYYNDEYIETINDIRDYNFGFMLYGEMVLFGRSYSQFFESENIFKLEIEFTHSEILLDIYKSNLCEIDYRLPVYLSTVSHPHIFKDLLGFSKNNDCFPIIEFDEYKYTDSNISAEFIKSIQNFNLLTRLEFDKIYNLEKLDDFSYKVDNIRYYKNKFNDQVDFYIELINKNGKYFKLKTSQNNIFNNMDVFYKNVIPYIYSPYMYGLYNDTIVNGGVSTLLESSNRNFNTPVGYHPNNKLLCEYLKTCDSFNILDIRREKRWEDIPKDLFLDSNKFLYSYLIINDKKIYLMPWIAAGLPFNFFGNNNSFLKPYNTEDYPKYFSKFPSKIKLKLKPVSNLIPSELELELNEPIYNNGEIDECHYMTMDRTYGKNPILNYIKTIKFQYTEDSNNGSVQPYCSCSPYKYITINFNMQSTYLPTGKLILQGLQYVAETILGNLSIKYDTYELFGNYSTIVCSFNCGNIACRGKIINKKCYTYQTEYSEGRANNGSIIWTKYAEYFIDENGFKIYFRRKEWYDPNIGPLVLNPLTPDTPHINTFNCNYFYGDEPNTICTNKFTNIASGESDYYPIDWFIVHDENIARIYHIWYIDENGDSIKTCLYYEYSDFPYGVWSPSIFTDKKSLGCSFDANLVVDYQVIDPKSSVTEFTTTYYKLVITKPSSEYISDFIESLEYIYD